MSKLSPQQKAVLSKYYPELNSWLNQREDNSVADALAAEILKKIEMVKGEKGDKGDMPVKGKDYWTDKELQQIVNHILKLATPKKGEHYFDGEKGDSYILTSKDKKEIASQVDVPIVEKIIEKTEIIKEVLLKDLDTVSKKDFEIREKKILDGMARVDGRIKLIDQRWGAHGGGTAGGLTKVSHDTTLTGLGTPASPLSVVGGGSSGGGGILGTPQVLTGLVNGSNKSFTFPTAFNGSSIIDLNGQILLQGVDYTVSGTTATYTSAPPDTGGNDTHYIIAGSGSSVASSGHGAPATTPTAIGNSYVDVDTANIYIATGTSSSADWKLIASY